MFNKILKSYNLKRTKYICSCSKDKWCEKCMISKLVGENGAIYSGRSGDGSDMVRIV